LLEYYGSNKDLITLNLYAG